MNFVHQCVLSRTSQRVTGMHSKGVTKVRAVMSQECQASVCGEQKGSNNNWNCLKRGDKVQCGTELEIACTGSVRVDAEPVRTDAETGYDVVTKRKL